MCTGASYYEGYIRKEWNSMDGSDMSNMVGTYVKGEFSLIESLRDLLGTQWKFVHNGSKIPGYNLWSWMWVNGKKGPGKIHLITSDSAGTRRRTVIAEIHGERLSGEYHTDEDFYLLLVDTISKQFLYQTDYLLKNDPEVLDSEE